MNRSLFAAAILAAGVFSSSAMAADQAVSIPPDAWGGLYFGAEVGYSLANTSFGVSELFDWNGTASKGWSAGGFVGYDHVLSGGWVAGLELGGDWNDIASTVDLTIGDGAGGYDYKANLRLDTDWSASLSARLGYLVNPQTLFFTSLGATVAHGRGSYELGIDNVLVESAKDQDLFYGVAFAAVGAETVLSSHLRGRFEYVASFLNTNEYDIGLGVPFEVTPMIGTAKAALIYDFGGGNGSAMPAGYAPASWTGFYAGVDGGQSVGLSKYSVSGDDDSFSYAGFGSDGWSGGALAGFNLQLGSTFVVGLEVGATASTLTSEYQFFDGSQSIDFKGTNSSWYDARLRAGVLVSPGTLIYGFAGLSRVNSDLTITDTTGLLGGGSMSQSYDRDAVEFGGGIEAYLARAFSLRAEYSYTMLDPIDAVPDYPEFGKFDMDQATATVAAIYHFGQ